MKSTSRSKSTLARSGSLPYSASMHAQVLELELLGDVRHPALAEALPGQRIDAARAQHGPHGHLEGAGVGGRHDGRTGSPAAGRAAPWSCRWRASGAPCLPWRGASGRGTPFRGFARDQPGRLAQGPEEKCSIGRPLGRFRRGGHEPTLPDSCPSLGRGVPPAASNSGARACQITKLECGTKKKAGRSPPFCCRSHCGAPITRCCAQTDARLVLPVVAHGGLAELAARRQVDADLVEVLGAVADVDGPAVVEGDGDARHQRGGEAPAGLLAVGVDDELLAERQYRVTWVSCLYWVRSAS